MNGYPMSTAGTQTYLSKSVNQNNFLKEQENKLEILKRKMATDYYEVENFSFVSPGDYLYIIENDRPQKIKCIYVDKYTGYSGSHSFSQGTGPKMKKIYFVRVSNTNNSIIINDKEEEIAHFNKKNEIITPNESYTEYDEIITGKDLFLYWGSNSEIIKKYQTQMIILTISDSILSNGTIKSCTPTNKKIFNCFYFWKKRIIPTITRATSASTFGGKRKKTKRRRQIRRKTKKQRKTRHK